MSFAAPRAALTGLAALAALVTLPMTGCISAPPAPLDAAQSAHQLTARSLQDPEVVEALAKAGLPAMQPGGRTWTLDALTIAAWMLRPEVAVAAADLSTSSAAQRVASELPNPSLSLGPGYVVRNANHNVSPWILTTALGFTVETGGKRGIRTAQARATTQSLRWAFAETLWRTRQDVRRTLLERELAQLAMTLAEQDATLRARYADWIDTQIRFGAATQPDRLAAQTSLAQSQAQLRTAGGDLNAADAALAAALGVVGENLPLAQLVAVDLDALPDPNATPQATWRGWSVINRLSVNHALADYQVAEQDLRMAVARQYPDIAFGPGYSFDKGDGIINLGLGVTLPLFHGERAQIDQALALRQKAARQFEVVQAQALAEIDSALVRYRASHAAWQQSRDAEAAAATAAMGAQRRLTLGAADRGELLTAQSAALVARRATLDALRTAVAALSAMEDGVQRPVWPASSLTIEQGPAACCGTRP